MSHSLTRTLLSLAAAGLLLAAGASCRSLGSGSEEATYPPVLSSDFGDMRNVSVCGPLWLGAMPSEEDLELASRRGIVQVIDLSLADETNDCDVQGTCARLELDYIDADLPSTALPTPESVDLVLEHLVVEELPPTLMFDGTGGRCAIFLAIYRAVVLQVPIEEALTEARRAGMKPGEPEVFVREQVARLTGESAPTAGN